MQDNENNEKRKLKKQRVILNLTEDQAQTLLLITTKHIGDPGLMSEFANKISKRIDWTIMKQQYIRKCAEDGFKPTKEQISKFKETLK
jgi:hypothetical protein